MSKMNTEKRNPKIQKLSLNRETLRTVSTEQLEEVAGGVTSVLCSLIHCGWTTSTTW
jgi:hypothetical protein